MLRKLRCQPDNENITHERRKTFYLLVASPSAALLLIQHSIEELWPSLRGNIMVLVATLINHFWPIKTIQELLEQKNAYRNIAIE